MSGQQDRWSRRSFLRTTVAGTGAFLSQPLWAAESAKWPKVDRPLPKEASSRVQLGNRPIHPTFLAMGTGFRGYNHSSELTRKGEKAFRAVMDRAWERGIRFFDMADLYGSHSFVRKGLEGKSRKEVVLLTKIWPRKARWNTPSGGAKAEVSRFLEELGTDYLDVCLIHCMLDAQWPEQYQRIREELEELKQQGVVRAVGVSCHDLGALRVAAEHPWVDVVLARINHRGGKPFRCDGPPEVIAGILRKARANGKGVIGMKIFGEGHLVEPAEKDASIRFVLEHRLVDAMTIGFLRPEEVDDAVDRINRTLRELRAKS